MKFLLNDDEIEIINPVSGSTDAGLVKLPTNTGKEVPRYSDEVKERIANDILNGELTGKEAASIYGVSQPLANSYARGEGLEGVSKERVLAKKYEIQDLAVVKLMDTLKLINPEQPMKTRDRIALMTGLGNLVDKITDKAGTPNPVHIHFYSPNQKQESDYPVVEGIVTK